MIRITDAFLSADGKTVYNNLSCSDSLAKYFRLKQFYASYPKPLTGVPLGLLNIPVLSSVAHFAIAVGASVETGEVDTQYLDALENVQHYLSHCKGFESLKFGAAFNAKPVRIEYGAKGKALLFSGGSDSTCSYIAHRKDEPKLITLWGLDIPTWWIDFWHKIEEQYAGFNPLIVKTNSEEIYHSNKLYEVGAKLVEGYRPTYSYIFNTLGLCAPLCCTEGIGDLMLSSTYPSREYGDPRYPWGSRPNVVLTQLFKWGETRCREVLHEYSTNEKIKYFLKPYAETHNVTLRCCGNRAGLEATGLSQLNCCQCDKCGRTIGMLVVNGLDPRKFGFPQPNYARIRSDIEMKRWRPQYLKYHWEELQRAILRSVPDYGGSRAFLEWLRNYRWTK